MEKTFARGRGWAGSAGAIARQGEVQAVSRAVLARQLPGPLAAPINRLLQRDLIEAVNGGYRFQVELIRRWFDKS